MALFVLQLSLICCSIYFGLTLELPQLTAPLVHMVHLHKQTVPHTDNFRNGMYSCAAISAMQHLRKDATLVIWTDNVGNVCRHLQTVMNFSSCQTQNVRVESLEYNLIFNNTPLQSWYHGLGTAMNSTRGWRQRLAQQNLGNAARLALMYLYGGLYVDSDLIVYGSKIINLETPTFALEGCGTFTGTKKCNINNAFMSFPTRRHEMLLHIMQTFVARFGWKWGHNGPGTLTIFFRSNCTGKHQAWYCSCVTLLPQKLIYPVSWQKATWILNRYSESMHRECEHESNNSTRGECELYCKQLQRAGQLGRGGAMFYLQTSSQAAGRITCGSTDCPKKTILVSRPRPIWKV